MNIVQYLWNKISLRDRLSPLFLSKTEPKLFLPDEILQIKRHAIESHAEYIPISSNKESEQLLLGENKSRFSGSGIDYEEQRKFQPGDDFRRVNWRAYAKTGELYNKLFVEERRPCTILLLDRRPSMWFGTKTQLKITLATSLAYHYIFTALAHQKMVGGLLFNRNISWFPPKQSENAIVPMIQEMNKTSLSVTQSSEKDKRVELIKILSYATSQLEKGDTVVLISDFIDYQEEYKSHLIQLQKHHHVVFLHILDPAELALPLHGVYSFRDKHSGDEVSVNCAKLSIRQMFHQEMMGKAEVLKNHCHLVGIEYQCILTNSDDNQEVAIA